MSKPTKVVHEISFANPTLMQRLIRNLPIHGRITQLRTLQFHAQVMGLDIPFFQEEIDELTELLQYKDGELV